jgi:hypothetical protein
MRFTTAWLLTTVLAVIFLEAAPAQMPPELSTQPLSADQIAVYQEFLRSYDANFRRNMQLQNYDQTAKAHMATYTSQLGPAEFPVLLKLHGCLTDLGSVVGGESIHLIPNSLIPADMDLVDPATQRAKDRQERAQKAEAPSSGLKTDTAGYLDLSEIVFTSDRRLAVFRYSYTSGGQGGTGGFEMYELEHSHWVQSRSRHCGSVLY